MVDLEGVGGGWGDGSGEREGVCVGMVWMEYFCLFSGLSVQVAWHLAVIKGHCHQRLLFPMKD